MSDFNLHTVLEHYGWELPGERSNWVTVKCGAHDDSHQSCRINADAGFVLCLACGFPNRANGKAGSATDVVTHYEGVSYRDAVRRCEEITGTSSSDVSQSGRSRRTVPSGSRSQQRNRKYVPPRLRRRTDDRP